MTKVTKNLEEKFLELLAAGVSITRACDQINVSRKTMYDRRKKRSKFKEAWDDALEDVRVAKLAEAEAELHRRAVKGVPVGSFRHNDKTYPKLRYSDALLLALLKALDPDKYGDKPKEDGDGDTGPALLPLISFVEPEPPKEDDPSDGG